MSFNALVATKSSKDPASKIRLEAPTLSTWQTGWLKTDYSRKETIIRNLTINNLCNSITTAK